MVEKELTDVQKELNELKETKELVEDYFGERIEFCENTGTPLDVSFFSEIEECLQNYKDDLEKLRQLEKNGCVIILGNKQNFKGIIDVNSYQHLPARERLERFIARFGTYVMKDGRLEFKPDEKLFEPTDCSIKTFFETYNFDELDIEDKVNIIRDVYFELKKLSKRRYLPGSLLDKDEDLKLTNLKELLISLDNEVCRVVEEKGNVTITKHYGITEIENSYYLKWIREEKIIRTPLGRVEEIKIKNYNEKGEITSIDRILSKELVILYVARTTDGNNWEEYYTYNGKEVGPEDLKEIINFID